MKPKVNEAVMGYLAVLDAEIVHGIGPKGLKSNCPSNESPASGELTVGAYERYCHTLVTQALKRFGATDGDVFRFVKRVAIYGAVHKGKMQGFRVGALEAAPFTGRDRKLKGRQRGNVEIGVAVAITYARWTEVMESVIKQADAFEDAA